MPALGILYIAALIRKEGLPVKILDAEGLGLDLDTTILTIIAQNPGILGITTTTLSVSSAAIVAKRIKTRIPQMKVFLGGPHTTAMPIETMEAYTAIDGCILGDGELSFLKIVQNIQDGIDYATNVNGLAWRYGDDIVINQRKGCLKNLDTLPFPAWDLLTRFPKNYRPPFHSYRRLPVANIITTRGCPYACFFCDRSVFGRKINCHSIDYIIAMIEYVLKEFNVREISIKDDMFVLSPERVLEFCRHLRNKKFNVTWSCNARVDNVKDEILKEMKKAGCWLISYGIESGSPKMLKKMMKGITKEQIVDALRLTRKNGIVSKGFFMLGVPEETVDTMNETLNFIKELPLDELNVNIFTPFPGSKLYQEVLREGFIPNFDCMNMVAPVYVPIGLTEEDLTKYQKKIIRSFYFTPSKLALYSFRAIRNINELKRVCRMANMAISFIHHDLRNR